MTPDERLHHRPAAGRAGHDRRLALLRPRLQVRPGDRRNPRRPRDARRDPARHLPLPPRPVRLNPSPLARSFLPVAPDRKVANLGTGRGPPRPNQRISRRSGHRFADKDMRQQTMRRRDVMLGLMQDWPLLMSPHHRSRRHPARRPRASSRARSKGRSTPPTTRDVRHRALKVAQRLERDGIKLGDRVATLAWNTWRHIWSLVRHRRHRRRLPHRQSAPVPRPDRLDRQPRRRPRDDDRPDLRAAAGEAAPTSCRRSSATSCSPTRPTCRRPR